MKKKNFASLKPIKKEVGPGVGSGCGAESISQRYGSPTMVARLALTPRSDLIEVFKISMDLS
jgi:hypothetical protein